MEDTVLPRPLVTTKAVSVHVLQQGLIQARTLDAYCACITRFQLSTRGRHDAAFSAYIRYVSSRNRCVVNLRRNDRNMVIQGRCTATLCQQDWLLMLLTVSWSRHTLMLTDSAALAAPAASHCNSITSRIMTCRKFLCQTSQYAQQSIVISSVSWNVSLAICSISKCYTAGQFYSDI